MATKKMKQRKLKRKLKIISIKQIIEDKSIYPRLHWDWQTTYDYQQSMKTGAIFPPITIALFNGYYLLVDGKHRIEAYKKNKVDLVQCEILFNLTKKEILLEAIRTNISHGRKLTDQEKATLVLKLEDMKYNFQEISKIINIPLDKLKKYTYERVTNTNTGEVIGLKAPLKHLVNTRVNDNIILKQSSFSDTSQSHILEQLLNLLQNKLINLKDPKVKTKLKEIKKLLSKIKLN